MKISKSHKVWSLLQSTSLLSLATVSKEGTPQCAVLVFDYDQDLHFFFATNKHSSKAKNIDATKLVSFAIVGKDLDMTLQGNGQAKKIEGKEMIEKAKILLSKADRLVDGWSPIAKHKGEDLVVYEVIPDSLRLLDISAKNDMFDGLAFEQLLS
jgi:nitroimidazol reductase NimA-like FMN-containing flavoprotein (pyridoxamine 5'-phosphate oxidase superfamily)